MNEKFLREPEKRGKEDKRNITKVSLDKKKPVFYYICKKITLKKEK